MSESLLAGSDGAPRCAWCVGDPEYERYHDEEWGRAQHDERRLFEKLCLEGFQSGLSWLTILRKRPAFRDAFADFDSALVAGFDERDVERLLADAGIVRNRRKIEATIANAGAHRALLQSGRSLDEIVWSFAPTPRPRPRELEDIRARTPEGDALARALRGHGFRFVGPTTAYALLQAVGVVDDHVQGCSAIDADHLSGPPAGPPAR